MQRSLLYVPFHVTLPKDTGTQVLVRVYLGMIKILRRQKPVLSEVKGIDELVFMFIYASNQVISHTCIKRS